MMKSRIVALTLIFALNVPAFANIGKLPVVQAPVSGGAAAAAGAASGAHKHSTLKALTFGSTLLLPVLENLPLPNQSPDLKPRFAPTQVIETPQVLPAHARNSAAKVKPVTASPVPGAAGQGRSVRQTAETRLSKKNGALPESAELNAFFDGAQNAASPLAALAHSWYEPSIYGRDNIKDERYESVLSRSWNLLANRGLDARDDHDRRRIQLKNAMIKRIETRDAGTGRHSLRVGLLSGLIALKMGVTPLFAERLAWAATYHDFGKTEPVITETINKPGKLNDEEFATIKRHSLIGSQMLSELSHLPKDLRKLAARVALEHHERLDGSGYPFGKRGRQISKWGRIVAVADVFDALMENRPYREGMSIEKALSIMSQEAAGFDRRVRKALLEILAEVGFEAGKKTLKTPKRARIWSWTRVRDTWRNALKNALLHETSARTIARGVALGILIAMTPTVGLQWLMILALSKPLRASTAAAMSMIWITNPLTLAPFYWLEYTIGSWFNPAAPAASEALAGLLGAANEGLIAGINALLDVGLQVFGTAMLGGLILGAALAVPLYFLTLRAVKRYKDSGKAEPAEAKAPTGSS
ncbi:MAG: DUF2062 domain-containing protein [Elusimicrobiota bacterium]